MKKFTFLFVCLLGTLAAWGQTVRLHGHVTDSSTAQPLAGVTVHLQSASTGTVTDAHGNFSLQAPSASHYQLVFSFVGYQTTTVSSNGMDPIDVQLPPSEQLLNQLVVVGYGTVNKRDLTGSVATVDGEQLAKAPVADVTAALAGKLPGVNVTSQDGRPGASISIVVRGGGSISQSNEPLFIVDGFPVGNISDIPADDIASVSVLKDASATAIYGARGSHGVIIVTTKKGQKGKMTLSYDGYVKFNTAPKYMHTMDAYDYIAYNWAYAAAINDNYSDAWEQLWGIGKYASTYNNPAGIDHYKNVPATNFEKEVYGSSVSHNHNLTLSYGNDKTQYRLSLNYLDDQGMKVNSYYKRLYADFNLNQKLASTLTFSVDARFSGINRVDNESTSNGQGSILSSAYWFRPIATKDVLGELDETVNTQLGMYDDILQDVFNPVARIKDYTPLAADRSVRANTYLSWEAIPGLTLKSAVGISGSFNRSSTWSGAIYNDYLDTKGNKTYSGNATIDHSDGWDLVWTNTINYQVKGLGADNNLNILVGQELTNSGSKSTEEWGNKYPATYSAARAFANMQDYLSGTSEVDYGISSSYGTPDRLLSFFGRANYSLYDKYLFTATFRADGSSRFAPSHQWGYFPAGAVAWRLSEEKFLKNVDWLSNLKLRLSYGTSGDDGISAGLWEQNWASQGLTGYSINEVQQPAYAPASSTIANPNLKWETTITRDLGLDYGFFNDRIRGTLDVYKNTTKNLLMLTTISAISGFSSTYENVGSTSNTGVELGISGDIVHSKNFNLTANFNISINRNKIDALAPGVNGLYATQWGSSMTQPNTGDYELVVGKPVGIVRGYVYDGWYTVDDFSYKGGVYTLNPNVPDISAGILGTVYGTTNNKPSGQVAYPGVLKFKDLNGDGVVDEKDVTDIGNMNPKHTGGFAFNGNYKNIDFALDFNWSYGNQVYDVSYLAAFYGSKEDGLYRNRLSALSSSYRIYDIENGQLTSVTDPTALKALNKNATTFLPYQENPIASTLGIKDGSYLRLNTVVLGYTLPETLTGKIGMSTLRIYGTIYNAFVLTNYPGLDPDVNTNTHQGGAIYPTPGMDWGAYPHARSFVVGINARF
jgi:TonB-linked SusC/RagA family outer membrane protein